ncbi:MAG: hypothetical protein V1802_00130 [Candidatus Aenigmatarchaeota archaeon]
MVVKHETKQEIAPETEIEALAGIPVQLYTEIGGKRVFSSPGICRGCGSLLAMKIALSVADNCVAIVSPGALSYQTANAPVLSLGANACAAAVGVSRAMKDKIVICFADYKSTQENLGAITSAATTNENMIYICINDSQGIHTFARSIRAKYDATASVGYLEDYINKLNKAKEMFGFRFIDVFCPCPRQWGFNPSDTLQLARLASDTRLWPLYEIDNDILYLTKRPKQEPVHHFFSAMSHQLPPEEIQHLQHKANRIWKLLSEGRIV